MERTKLIISEEQALEAYSSDSYLAINKRLLQYYGPEIAVFLCNLIDKYRYFKIKDHLLDDCWFFLIHTQQMEQTGLTELRIRECKKRLKQDEILETKQMGLPSKEYYKLNIKRLLEVMSLEVRSRPPEIDRSSPPENGRSIYKDNKYQENKKILRAEEEATKEKYITKTMFDDFWELYLKKVDKGKALTAWNKIVSRKNDRPTWREVKKAIIYQKKTERWQDRKFIPHPTTWLNQNRWLDDPAEMKSIDRSSTNKPDKRMEGGEWYYLTATSSGNHYYVSKSGKILDE